jgi:hypothetical protein
VESPHLDAVFPDLAGELARLLCAADEGPLAESVPELRIVGRCRCADDFCATFYTALPPQGAYGPTHRNIGLDPEDGMIILDVEHGRIVCVEILYRPDFRRRLLELLP